MSGFKIQKLQATNFRNLSNDIFHFNEGINCIFGENGNGKTNLLEALYVLTQRKSFRKNTSFPQYLSMDGDNTEVYLSSCFQDQNKSSLTYSGKLHKGQSVYSLNGEPTKKRLKVPLIFINPFDSFSFHTSASFRRNWFDTYLSQMSPSYKKTLSAFNNALRFRNTLLSKKPSAYREQVLALDETFALHNYQIVRERLKFLEDIKDFCTKTFQNIFSESHILELFLESDFAKLFPDEIQQFYKEKLPQDEIVGHTSAGIHRDDFVFFFDGMNSFEYCSLGQQKMSYLSLLFAYIELFRYKFNAYPIVLIDDVSGELDRQRWGSLIDYLIQKEFQVLITTANEAFRTELEKIPGINQIFIHMGKPSQLN